MHLLKDLYLCVRCTGVSRGSSKEQWTWHIALGFNDGYSHDNHHRAQWNLPSLRPFHRPGLSEYK
jgi:hypothetical protein